MLYDPIPYVIDDVVNRFSLKEEPRHRASKSDLCGSGCQASRCFLRLRLGFRLRLLWRSLIRYMHALARFLFEMVRLTRFEDLVLKAQ